MASSYRKVEIIGYPDDGFSLSDTISWCMKNNYKFASILHDKDLKEDGTLKKSHVHFLVWFNSPVPEQNILKRFPSKNPEHIDSGKEEFCVQLDQIKSDVSAFNYLTHKNNPDKYQYSSDDVKANCSVDDFIKAESERSKQKELFLKAKLVSAKKQIDNKSEEDDLNALYDAIANGYCKPYNLTDFVPVEFYAKHKTRIDRSFDYYNKYTQKESEGLREMECVFISGASGAGKSTLAVQMAKREKYAIYRSSSGNNMLDDYAGEECIILDDLRPSSINFADFLKLTDNYYSCLVSSRYYNKSIVYCKMLIVTSVLPLEKWYEGLQGKEEEPIHQLFRRFTTCVTLTKDDMAVSVYDDESRSYLSVGTFPNCVCSVIAERKKNERALARNILIASGLNESFADSLLDKSHQMNFTEFSAISSREDDDTPF